MLILGGYPGKWFRKQHIRACGVEKWKAEAWESARQTRVSVLHFPLNALWLDRFSGWSRSLLICRVGFYFTEAEEEPRYRVLLWMGGFQHAEVWLWTEAGGVVWYKAHLQHAALSPIPSTMQKEKWRIHKEWRELMICEPRLLAFSIQTSGLDA